MLLSLVPVTFEFCPNINYFINGRQNNLSRRNLPVSPEFIMKFNLTFQLFTAVFLFACAAVSIADAQWTKQNVDTKASLRGLSVVSENVVWASGTGGTFLKTVDGGKTWTVGKVPDADKLDFRDVEAFDANTAYLLSIGEGENSRIYKTTDGGKTWKLQFQNKNPKAFFDALAFWDKTHGIAMSDPVDGKYVLIETTDGETWKPIENLQMPNVIEGEAAFAASGTCLITEGKNNAFLVSGGNAARVFKSENRGKSWKAYETPITKGTAGSGIFSIAMFDKKRGVIVGGNYEKPNETNNNLAFTTDGGKTWKLSKGLNGYRSSVAFIKNPASNFIMAVGSNGSDFSLSGEEKWKQLDKENYNSVKAGFASGFNLVFWAVGANGRVAKYYSEIDF